LVVANKKNIKPTMLELRKITKRFGDVVANDNIDIKVKSGTIAGRKINEEERV
jgi:ABC-type sugar transport system ATPase subunit